MSTYNIKWSEQDKVFIARIREYPGIMAHGKTEFEAKEELITILEAIAIDAIKTCAAGPWQYDDPPKDGKYFFSWHELGFDLSRWDDEHNYYVDTCGMKQEKIICYAYINKPINLPEE